MDCFVGITFSFLFCVVRLVKRSFESLGDSYACYHLNRAYGTCLYTCLLVLICLLQLLCPTAARLLLLLLLSRLYFTPLVPSHISKLRALKTPGD
jgi:hypothetical protein